MRKSLPGALATVAVASIAVASIAVALMLTVSACAKEESADESHSTTVPTEQADGAPSNGSGETKVDLPEGWPNDVALPEDISSTQSSTVDMNGKQTITLGGETSMSTDELKSFFRSTLGAWEETYSSDQDAKGTSVTGYELDGRQLMVNISTVGESRMLNLSYTPASTG